MRVRLTNYTLVTKWLKSWVLEASLDGVNWKEIDRQTDTVYFKDGKKHSFDVADRQEWRFFRLTQTGERHRCDNFLYLRAVEFFGKISD
jgi:hypothetical protein